MKKAIVIILLVVVVLVGAYIAIDKLDFLAPSQSTSFVYDDEDEQMEALKNIELQITDAVLGEARETAELIVLERDITVTQTWDKSWWDWEIFSKTKKIKIHATGYYVVDLAGIDKDSITVDEDKLTVTIDVPDVKLKNVDIDLENTEFEDTKNGLLRFGEIKVTAEQSTLMLAKCEDVMETELSSDENLAKAQKSADKQLENLFANVIGAISNDYTVVIA